VLVSTAELEMGAATAHCVALARAGTTMPLVCVPRSSRA
jgi:hypothetical protein